MKYFILPGLVLLLLVITACTPKWQRELSVDPEEVNAVEDAWV